MISTSGLCQVLLSFHVSNKFLDGMLVKLFETKGEDAVLHFAEINIEPLLYEGGPRTIGVQEYNIWKTQMVNRYLLLINHMFR